MTAPVLFVPFKTIHLEAVEAAKATFEVAFARIGGKDNYPCGFAWVNVQGIKLSTNLGKEFAALGFRKTSDGGINIYNPSGSYIQNMDVKYEAARAYAQVLRKYGFNATACERLD